MKIALIEDEPDCYENYQVLLEARKHEVCVYKDADEVVAHMESICKSDVIILDLMMQLGTIVKPEEAIETGLALYARIRKVSATVRIVVLTAKSRSEVWDTFNSDLNIKYLPKPVSNLNLFYSTIEEK